MGSSTRGQWTCKNLSRLCVCENRSCDILPEPQSTHVTDCRGVEYSRLLWPECFTQGQSFAPGAFNKSCIEYLREEWGVGSEPYEDEDEDDSSDDQIEEEGDDEGDGVQDEDEDPCLASQFMRGRIYKNGKDIPEKYLDQADEVESFCGHVGLSDFTEKGEASLTESNSLLDERSETGERRADRGPMNSLQIFEARRQERFVMGRPFTAASQEVEAEKVSNLPADAARRALYINNLNPHSAIALMATASLHEAQIIRDLVHQHLVRGTEIEATVRSHGFRTFTFKVNIPSHSLSKVQIADARGWSDGTRLRKSRELPRLRKRRRSPDDLAESRYAHEKQTSLVLTGFDDKRWTAIGLIDDLDNKSEGAEYYHYFTERPGLGRADPLARGETESSCPIQNPRLYFLRIWKEQISQTAKEWNGLVYWFEQSAKQWVFLNGGFKAPLPYRAADSSLLRSWEDDASTLREVNARMAAISQQQVRQPVYTKAEILSVSQILRLDLDNIVTAWNHFQNGGIKYFQVGNMHLREAEEMMDCLRSIETVYSTLKVVRERWKTLDERLTNSHVRTNPICVRSRYYGTNYKQLNIILPTLSIDISHQSQILLTKNIELTKDNLELVHAQTASGDRLQNLSYISMVSNLAETTFCLILTFLLGFFCLYC